VGIAWAALKGTHILRMDYGVVMVHRDLLVTSLEFHEDLENAVSEKVDLTTFNLQEESVVAERVQGIHQIDIDPYPKQEPLKMIDREYLLLESSFAAPSSAASLVEVGFFSNPTTHITALNKLLTTYRYARWKAIEYRLVLTASPMLYGFIGLTCCPSDSRRNADPSLDYGWLSHDDTVLVDLTSMTEVNISVPWNVNQPWLSTQDISTNSVLLSLTALKIINMNKIFQLESTGPTSIPYQVFGRLIQPELAGFKDAADAEHEAQSLGYSESQSLLPPALQGGYPRSMGLGTGAALGAVGVGTHLVVQNTINWMVGKATEKVAEAVVPTAVTAAETTTNNSQDVVPNIMGGMVVSPYKNMLGVGNQNPSNTLYTHSLAEFLRKPALVSMGSTSSASFNFGNIGSVSSYEQEACSRIEFLSQFFRMWRGSLRYTLVFFSSPFVTWRGSIRFNYTNTVPFQIGDTPYRNFTVRGSTVVSFNVPFLYPEKWIPFSSLTYLGFFRNACIHIDSVSGFLSAANPTLTYLVYESAGDDFQLCSQQEPADIKTYSTHQVQMKICEFHSGDDMTGAGLNSTHPSEIPESFESMVKRWVGRTHPASVLSNQPDFPGATSVGISTYDAIPLLFFYWRGSTKFRIKFDDTDIGADVYITAQMNNDNKPSSTEGMSDLYRAADGMAIINFDLTRMLEYTVPFLCTQDWAPVSEANIDDNLFKLFQPFLSVFEADNAPVDPIIDGCWISAGTDYAYAYQLPPPCSDSRWYNNSSLEKPKIRLQKSSKERAVRLSKRKRPKAVVEKVLKIKGLSRGRSNNGRSSEVLLEHTTSV
jgi:hypothetical protein